MTDIAEPGRRHDPGRRRGIAVAALLVVAFAVGGALLGSEVIGRRGLPTRATAEGVEVENLWRIFSGIAGSIAGIVLALLIVALVTGWRNRRGPEPEQAAGSVPLELVYTAIPLAIVAVVFALSLRASDREDTAAPEGTPEVLVTAFQWGWRFEYDDGTVVVGTANEPPEMVLPVDQTVVLALESPDVVHSFYSPAFLTKLDVIPGRTNELVVKPIRRGTYLGHCAEFCGLDHARMGFTVRIVGADEFAQWRDEQQNQAGGP